MKKTLLLLLIIFSPVSFALGLGQAKLHSALGEKLSVEIPLLGVENLSNEEILSSLASVADFQRLNIERHNIHNDLRFQLVRKARTSFIQISSSKPVNEPYIQFVVQVSTPQKTLLRDVTLLLDTPNI